MLGLGAGFAIAQDDGSVSQRGIGLAPLNGVYHALEYTDDPARGGELLSEQWASRETGASRTEDGESITTRSAAPCQPSEPAGPRCVQMRQLTALDANDDAYVIYTGASQDDRRIRGTAWILEPSGFKGQPAGQGPLPEALAAWQSPPPGHGTEYELYELDPTEQAGGIEGIERIWVDGHTKLPLRTATVGRAGELLGQAFFTYDQQLLDPAELPPSFFAVQPTQHLVIDKEVRVLGAGPVGLQVDEETQNTFEPHYLGTAAVIAGHNYCLATSHSTRIREVIDLTPPGDAEEDPENAMDPAAEAIQTSVGASYNATGAGESCSPGEGPLEAPQLGVTSEAASSPLARSARQAFRERAAEIESRPTEDPDAGGVTEVNFQGTVRPAYAVGDDGVMSVLIVGDETQVTVSGPFDQSEIKTITALLEPQ